jgi:GNAT superfamily N-acetyltransferase
MELKINHLQKDYDIKALGPADEKIVQKLCEKCPEFFNLISGKPAENDAGYEILYDLPGGKNHNDKIVFGFFNDKNELIAISDMVKNYTCAGEWTIGLLLIGPLETKKGLGKIIHKYLAGYAKSQGADKLRIGVAEENINAIKFWNKLGYKETSRIDMKYGNKSNLFIIMNLSI